VNRPADRLVEAIEGEPCLYPYKRTVMV
jgi:hypothetical protein